MEDLCKELEHRVAEIETKQKYEFASQEWVNKNFDAKIKPLVDSQIKTQESLQEVSGNVQELAKTVKEIWQKLASTQDEMMKARGEQEAQQHRAKMERLEQEKAALEEKHQAELKAIRERSFIYIIENKWKPALAALGILWGVLFGIFQFIVNIWPYMQKAMQ